jgi:hypothetical protein
MNSNVLKGAHQSDEDVTQLHKSASWSFFHVIPKKKIATRDFKLL